MSRRDLLVTGSAVIAGTLVRHEAEAAAAAEQTAAPAARKPPATIGEPYLLECKWIEKTMAGTRVKMRSYNGTVPGPMLKTQPGDTLRVRVKNSLPTYDSTGWNGDHNVPHDLNTTNLHLHGLDTRPHLFEPQGTTNPLAPMVAIEPNGGTYDYALPIPADHPPGLYWYHPHHHGSTAVQASSGMAGGVIVFGDIDKVPQIAAARDIPLVVQDLVLFESETEAGLWLYEPKQNAIWQTFGGNVTIYDPATGKNNPTNLKGGFTTGDSALHFFLLNGEPFFKETHNNNSPQEPNTQQLPAARITMAPGEVVRFRMLNGCNDNLMPIVVEGHEMYLLAMDGVNYPAPRVMPAPAPGTNTPQALLAPANRAEFLIKASKTPGTYRILQLEQDQQFIHSAAKTLVEIVVSGAAKDMALPTTLPTPKRYYPLIQPSEVSQVREIQFSGNFPAVMNPYVGGDFSINNALYDEKACPVYVTLDSVEQWNLEVGDMQHGGSEGHPFHIHVNHFEVISIGGTPMAPGTIQDTIWVPEDTTVVIRQKFKEFTGKSVYHCHILPHEDTGMMANFLIDTPAPQQHTRHPVGIKGSGHVTSRPTEPHEE
jgi:FtsP/CotA-like multicopper oxidase with cupredoxin domain